MEKIIEILHMLWKRKWVLLTAPILSALLVYALTTNQERRYASEATLSVSLPLSGNLTLSGQAYKQYEAGVFFNNLLESMKATKTVEMARLHFLREDFDRGGQYISFKKYTDLQKDSAQVKQRVAYLLNNWQMLDIRKPLDLAITLLLENNRLSIEAILSNLKVYRVASSHLIKLSTETENPYKSAALLDAYMHITIAQHKALMKGKHETNRAQLEYLVAQAKKNIGWKN